MKAKVFYNKLLAIVLTVVLVALSVPTAIFMVSASDDTPTVDAETDIGSYVNFYGTAAQFKEYDETGSLKVTSGLLTPSGANYTVGGTYYASVKMKFDPYYEYKYVADTATGKWVRGEGNNGIEWGQNGLTIGTMTDGATTEKVTIAYRRGQGSFYLFNDNTSMAHNLGGGATSGLDEVVITAKFNAATGALDVWFNGTKGNTIDTTALKDGWTFTFTGFAPKAMGGGSHPENFDDINNTNKVSNYVTFSDLHIWGNVTTTKHYMEPTIGDKENIADDLTLSDSTMDTDWKADGSFAWNYTNVGFNGINFADDTIVYASVTMTGLVEGGAGNDTYGPYFATDGTNYSYNFVRPQYNHQGYSGAAILTSSDGMGNANSDGSLKWTANQDQVVIYKYDVNANTVEVWLHTGYHAGYAWDSFRAADYQSVYVGKYGLVGQDMALGLCVNPNAVLSTFASEITVKDIKVWTETVSSGSGSESDGKIDFTLSDTALNDEYKANGSVVMDSSDGVVYINGYEVKKNVGQVITFSFDMSYSAKSGSVVAGNGAVNPAMIYAIDPNGVHAGYGPKPSYQQTGKVGSVTLANSIFDSTGSYISDAIDNKFKIIYDVDANTVELWMDSDRYPGFYEGGNMLMATATLDNGYTFKAGISAENVTSGTMTVSNIALSATQTKEDEETGDIDFTLSDTALNDEYKANGSVVMDSSDGVVYINGYEVKKNVGQVITFSFDMVYSATANSVITEGSGILNPTMVFANNNGTIAGYGPKPSWNHTSYTGGVTMNNVAFNQTGSYRGDNTNHTFKIIYDVDANTVALWATTNRFTDYFANGEMLMGTATLDNGYTFKAGISAENVTRGTMTVSNISITATETGGSGEGGSGTDPDDTQVENVLEGIPGLEGGTLDSGLAYNNNTDLGVSNTPVWTEGTTVNNTGIYTSLKQGGYYGKNTVIWKGLVGDLTKGSITYQADFTVYTKTTGWNGTNWGLVVATVDGHYISTGFGIHGEAGASYKNATVVDGSNLGEQAGSNTSFLGASALGNVTVTGTDTGKVVKVKAVLTETSLTTYIDGVKAQTFDFTGKTVVPQFAIAWGSGNPNDKISNVKIYGDGVSVAEPENKLEGLSGLEGGTLDSGLAYDNNTDLGVSNTPVWTIGTTVNSTGIYTSLKTGGYNGKKTVVWKDLVGDLTKGSITYQADLTVYNKTTGWGGDNSGFVIATVDGHYVTSGIGIHGAAGTNTYKFTTAIDGSNIGDQATGNTAFLGAAAVGGNAVTGTEAGTTVTLKVVLTATSITTYIDGVQGQTFDLTGKTVVPQFAFAWGSGNPNDKISNVKIYGDGVSVKNCEHEYSYACDTECDLCGEVRTVEDWTHEYKSGCAWHCKNCNAERALAPEEHSYDSDCDAVCNVCDEERTPLASHTFTGDCDEVCNNCGAGRTPIADHTYTDEYDSNCDICLGERIIFSTLINTTGALNNSLAEQLKNGVLTTGALAVNPGQYVTHSVVLGGLEFDVSKGYTIEADFTVKTNVNFESHFGITPVIVDNAPYTFGMCANGDWSVTPAAVIQSYTPYLRKNNGNELIVADNASTIGTTVATNAGVTVTIKVVVTENSVTYYINGTEAHTLDTTGKTVIPYASALTSRGANVEVSNIKVYGAGVKNHADHTYDSDCDDICNVCYGARKANDHQYDNETCDAECNVCGGLRDVPHVYSFACDDTCDIEGCGHKRTVEHTYTDDCDSSCNIEGCTNTREAPHAYENDCDTECDLCGVTRFVNKHVYDDNADLKCNNCDYVRPAFPDFSTLTDFTDDLYLNNKDYRGSLENIGSFTLGNGITVDDNALTAKDSGSIVLNAKLTFNGNVDFNWTNTNGDGNYEYANAWGKVGIKIGTYYDLKYQAEKNLYVSFRRCTAASHLFNDGNEVNYGNAYRYNFGTTGTKTVEEIELTVLYDIDNKVVHLWADGQYINVTTIGDLQDFKFDIGFVTQGLGTTAVDETDITNGESVANTVTISNVKVLGDLKADPTFEIPAVEHEHVYDDANDLICNDCGANKIIFSTLTKTNGQALGKLFKDHLSTSAAVTGTSFDMNPGQYVTQSIALGGAIYDLTKGGYTVSADFTVKTNSNLESHFGITGLTVNGTTTYTFGMLANGIWEPEKIPVQKYVPYVRKDNGNELIGASGTPIVATDEGVKVNLFVDVTPDRVKFYINGNESYVMDLTDKEIAPYVALTSRGANVTVSNIQFNAHGATNCTAHEYDGACDAICNVCYGGIRNAEPHTYDNDTCDADCNECGTVREVPHVYSFACDDTCDIEGCGATRSVEHTYTDDCDETCDIEGCTNIRTAPHAYDNDCDTECNICGSIRFVNKHVYDDNNDLECNRCGYIRPAYDFSGMEDHTDEMYLNNKPLRENLAANGNFVLADKVSTNDSALTIKTTGKVVIETKLTFNGNVDNYWVGIGGVHPSMSWVKDGEDGDGYANAYGKVAIKVGTYYNTKQERTMNVYVALRRASDAVYLFDDSNTVLGEFGAASLKNATDAKLTVLYNIDESLIHVWINGEYVNVVTLAKLSDFVFDVGFYASGLGTTLVDPNATAPDAETTENTVTYSDIKLLGDYQADPTFEIPAVEHEHVYDDANDLTCNDCGANKIIFSTLTKTNSQALGKLFKDHLSTSAVVTGTSFDMNPGQHVTQSIALGGAIYDLTKGGYTVSADFTVKTNSNLESHFGITGLTVNGATTYTFGMLANGNWDTDPASPIQTYTPYVRKNNGNDLIGATGTSIVATDEGVKVNLFVDVTPDRVKFYINGNESYVMDLTDKEIAPYVALTSRGANVTVSNIQFNAHGATNCTAHEYDADCDAICNVCYGGIREAEPHTYDNDTCDADCNECGTVREVPHVYSFVCDDTCDVEGCGHKRSVTHTYTDDCDETCDVEECTATRTAPHAYTNDCDTECDLCGSTRFVNKHVYDDNNDLECNNCGYKRPAFDFSGMADHTDEMYLNNKDFRENLIANGNFTMGDRMTPNDNALIAKDSGKIVLNAKITFNGNVDYNWVDNDNDGNYKYENAWGKVGFKLGTYFDVVSNREVPLYVSFRRCTAASHLFNDGNYINGANERRYNFGTTGTKTVEEIELTVLYDIDNKVVHLWADGQYINVTTIGDLQDFKFGLGFVTQGLGTSAVDEEDVTNGETVANTVTISNVKVLGDLVVDPNFSIPAIDHTHVYDDVNDLICNECGAEKIVFAPLMNTSGSLAASFKNNLKNSGLAGTAPYSMNPSQFSTHSLSLGGAIFDLTKGGYTVSADIYVKINSSMESHFGITAITVDGEPFTFGMLSNGNWDTMTPTQNYVPYVRKGNGNTLIGASGTAVTSSEEGTKVSLFVDVNDARAIFYINGNEAYVLDLTGKEVTPYAAITSRGANITVNNIEFNGKGVSNCAAHEYSGDCDAICDICYGGVRAAEPHTYDNETCDKDCNVCGTVREVPHVYSFVCDDTCDVCSHKRSVTHTYTDNCDSTCDIEGCTATRTAPHSYDHDCDKECNNCDYVRFVNKHTYDDESDLECNLCDFVRPAYPDLDSMVDHTDDYFINENDYREALKDEGKFTIIGDFTTSGGGLIAKESGKIAITTTLTFNGNIGMNWTEGKTVDGEPSGKYSYTPTWGKVGVKIGTYYDTANNVTKSLYVSFRRPSAASYIFDDNDRVNGENPAAQYTFGSTATSSVETMAMTILYDIETAQITLWVDGKYVNTCYVGELKNFQFNTGFTVTGAGTTAVDENDITNGNKTQNSVTFSDFKIYGDLDKDEDFVPKPTGVSPPAGSLEAPNPEEFDDATNDFHLDDGKLDKQLRADGKFTAVGDTQLSAAGVLLKENGAGYISTVMTFNGNVDFRWAEIKELDEETGEMVGTGEYAYTNGWGKYGIKIGTYTRETYDQDGNLTSSVPNLPVFVSWRRCTGTAYLFDSYNNVLGTFGTYGKTDATEIKMTVKLDDKLDMIYLWLDDYFVKAVSTSKLKDFKYTYGFVTQGTGTTAVDPTDSKNPEATQNSVTFSNVKVFGDFVKDLEFYIPELEPMTENLAKYIELRNGSTVAAYFDRKFNGNPGTNYTFAGLKYDETNAIYNISFDYVITERSKQKDGTDAPWGSIRLGIMEAEGYKYQLSTMAGATQLLANGGSHAGYTAPGFSQGSKVGEKHNIAVQYDFIKNRMSVWFDGELVVRAAELPATANDERTMLFTILFEACTGEVSDLKIWGTGMSVDVSEEYKQLLNDPFYTSTTIPAKPEGNINYWKYISGQNQTGDLAFAVINDEFESYWSDEQGRVIFRDSYGNRNLNGITNDTTFVARFKYRVYEDDPAYIEANKQCGSVFTVRGYNLPTSQGKKNNYEIGFYNNAITVTVLKDNAVVTSTSKPWSREYERDYDIAIVSAPNWVKIFVDGELMLSMGGLYQYTFDFCYESVHTMADFWEMEIYDVMPNDAAEPVKNNVPEKTPTGTTVNTIEHTNVPLATGTLSIWLIILCLGAVLCLAGAAVVTVVFIKKKKENQ